MAGLTINLKFEAERLSVSGRDLLDVARRLAQLVPAVNDPGVASELQAQAERLVRTAEDISSAAARLVGR
jgi:hypothetical protein